MTFFLIPWLNWRLKSLIFKDSNLHKQVQKFMLSNDSLLSSLSKFTKCIQNVQNSGKKHYPVIMWAILY